LFYNYTIPEQGIKYKIEYTVMLNTL